MKRFVAFTLILVIVACAKVPISNRRQMNLIPESELIVMSKQQYSDFLKQSTVVTGTPDSEMVERVGKKVAAAVESYMNNHGYQKRIAGFEWEFKLVDDPAVNAWCMPGGKICVYTGILEITEDETGLAVVMGHEVAHAIARHGNERMSKAMAAQMGGIALSVAVMNKGPQTQQIFQEAYGAGSGLGGLAFSRKNELESDKLGLVFMQLAGYDATEAIDFWKRMAQNGQAHPEFLSTHPSDERRVSEISKYLTSDKFKKHTKQ